MKNDFNSDIIKLRKVFISLIVFLFFGILLMIIAVMVGGLIKNIELASFIAKISLILTIISIYLGIKWFFLRKKMIHNYSKEAIIKALKILTTKSKYSAQTQKADNYIYYNSRTLGIRRLRIEKSSLVKIAFLFIMLGGLEIIKKV